MHRSFNNRRVQKLQKRRSKLDKRRQAVFHDGNKSIVVRSNNCKGYNVDEIRDFLAQLLLEVRVQQFENVKTLRALEETNEPAAAFRAASEPAPAIIEQLSEFYKKYQTALVPSNVLDGRGSTKEEFAACMRQFLKENIQQRDAQIGRLEALEELFDAALLAAKVPFGITRDGKFVEIQNLHVVTRERKVEVEESLPDFDDLKQRFDGHPLTAPESIEQLKQAEVIVAKCDLYEGPLVLFGADEIERLKAMGSNDADALVIPVEDFAELQFVIAAVRKYRGRADTDGRPWLDL